MLNKSDGMIGGWTDQWAGGEMWIWMVIGLIMLVMLVVVIVRITNK